MATATARPGLRLRYDNLFFSGMAGVALIAVLVGFARTYFLAGLFRAPLPNLLVHIHGAVFTLWIILFVTQISLITAGRVSVHRRIGLLGFVLAIVMIVVGPATASDRLARHVAQPGTDTVEEVRAFYAVSLGGMLMFSTFIYFGYRNRFQPAVHKRLMWFATMSLLDAGFDRWPVFDPYPLPVVNIICFTPLLILMIGYDWWSTGKVQRVTIWSTIFLVVVQQVRHPLGYTAVWQSFAAWVAMHMPSLSCRCPHGTWSVRGSYAQVSQCLVNALCAEVVGLVAPSTTRNSSRMVDHSEVIPLATPTLAMRTPQLQDCAR